MTQRSLSFRAEDWLPDSVIVSDAAMSFRGTKAPVTMWTRYIIFLCIRAIELHQSRKGYGIHSLEEDPIMQSSPFASQWQVLWTELEAWSHERPREMQPLTTMNGTASTDHAGLPMLLFTSAPSALACQLYHTATICLLQIKPRSLRIFGRHSSLAWNIAQLAGVACNNDDPVNWDPAMFASLLMVTKLVSSHQQQEIMLKLLQRIARAKTWPFDAEIDKVQQWTRRLNHEQLTAETISS